MGDFNADLGPLGGPKFCTEINEQGKILHRYVTKCNLVSTHLLLNPSSLSYTYESDAHATQSTIDHILCPLHMVANVALAFTILEEPLNSSDHNPVFAILRSRNLLLVPPSGVSSQPHSHSSHLRDWSKTPAVRIRQLYTTPLQQHLEHFLDNMPSESVLSTRPTLIDSLPFNPYDSCNTDVNTPLNAIHVHVYSDYVISF